MAMLFNLSFLAHLAHRPVRGIMQSFQCAFRYACFIYGMKSLYAGPYNRVVPVDYLSG